MVHIKEFRIGNLLMVDQILQSICAISLKENSLTANTFIGYLKEDEILYVSTASERVEPALLNDEILKRFGFVFDDYFKLWQKKKMGFGTGVELELDRDYTALDFAHRPIIKEMKHLHRLQNLYYTLRDKELAEQLQPEKEIK
jgi:hypothetical protein